MIENKETIEAEVVPTQAMAVRQQSGGLPTISDLEQSFALAVRQRELLSEYIKKQLKPGKHYYQRGDQKPSLAKEGAEIILLPHGLVPDYEWVSGPQEPPEGDLAYQVTIKCVLRAKGQPGSFHGSGIGSAGSMHQRRDGTYLPRQNDRYLCHNATAKMAQKSALIAATINSTAASEFFTQDMEAEAAVSAKPREPKPPPENYVQKSRFPTPATRNWMLNELNSLHAGDPGFKLVTEYFQKVGHLMPTEILGDLPLRFVPSTRKELEQLVNCIANFEAGGDAVAAFEPHVEDNVPMDGSTPLAKKPIEVPRGTTPMGSPLRSDDPAATEPWYGVIVPIPHKGQKRDDYLRNPDTIGSLYEARHDDEDARKRLWGFTNNYEPKGWVKRDGTQMPPNKSDIQFRAALDMFEDWFEDNHPDEKL